jgi:predicted choloylglycine hydrolase
MYHPRFKGRHYEMGLKFGNILKKANITFPIRLDKFQLEFGRKSSRLLKKYFPEAAEEIRGITDVICCNNEAFSAWMMCMGCCLYNLEDENNIEVRGCTAFSFEHNNRVYYGRDNDLPPFLKKGSKSICYQPENVNSFLLNTSSFINGEEGINCFGFTAAMTFVLPKLEEIKPGFNSVFIVRYLLEKCKNVSEGISALQSIPIASSCNILMADTSGDMVVAECTPGKIFFRYPESEGGRRFIVTVNHFVSEEMLVYDAAAGRGEYFSSERYQTAYYALKNTEITDGTTFCRELLSGKHGFICSYDKKSNFDTIWSSVFNLTTGEIYRAEGNPARAKYIQDDRSDKYIRIPQQLK